MNGERLELKVATAAHREVLDGLVGDRVASGLAVQNATLWGNDVSPEASIRLGWVDASQISRPLLAEIEALRAELAAEGVDRVVLCGMGGSSLAPEVITRSAGVDLFVLDSTDPAVVRRALGAGTGAAADADQGALLARTAVVVASKSGTTVETDSHRRAFLRAFADAGIDGTRRMVVVTDPDSPLADLGERAGYRRVFRADPNVGGRYSALTAFGLVPSGLAGVDVATLLDEAEEVRGCLAQDSPDNPALVLAAVLGAAHQAGREKVLLAAGAGAGVGFPAWAEQLVAESTGKHGRGLLPVDAGAPAGPAWSAGADTGTRVVLGEPPAGAPAEVTCRGPLGALFLLWETAIALAGRVIGINPFDQPNVEEAKAQARSLLDDASAGDGLPPAFTEGSVEVYGAAEALGGAADLAAVFGSLRTLAPQTGYLALQAYLDPAADAAAERLRDLVAAATGTATTFGWGPRFLHSTGQYHKGGHPNGGFVQLTGEVPADLPIPDRPYTFGQLQRAQAAGDARVLAARRPVIRLHLRDRAAGLAQLLAAAERAAR